MTHRTKAQLLDDIEELKQHLHSLNEAYKEAAIYERWYKNLREKEVIVMEEEGALYLKGVDLDRYCRKITPTALSRAQLLKELLPGLNQLFGAEYDEYQKRHGKELYGDDET